MALAIDSSSPAIATGAQTCTTASFTPPANALLLIAFSGNDDDWPQFPLAPTITDSLGSHLTYTAWAWQCGGAAGASASSRPSTGHEGQTAFWTASVISSAAMTISVTNNTTLGQSQCAIEVYVITGADLASPVGANGFNGSTSANSVSQSYTAQIDGGQGFLAVCDWSAVGAQTAGSGCTLDDTWTSVGFVSTAFLHRTIADDANGGLTALNASLPGTSTSLNWSYIEIQPGVGDPVEKDPPPFISFYAPGFGDAPNTLPMPWAGTANAGPAATGVIVHGSSPETAVNTAGTATGLTTSSFTPPAGSLLLVLWAGNSIDPTNPAAPTITDSLGTPLTYTLSDWQSRADTPTTDGQAAAWTAPVITSAPMTVTVNNNAASPNRHADLQVLVLIDANGRPTVGAHGKSGSTSASIITQSYTAQATGGLGFLSMCDWNAVGVPVPGTDCSIVRPGSVGTIPAQISYGQLKRTIPDDVNTVSNRLNVSLPATSTALNWVYIEILPAIAASGPVASPSNIRRRVLPAYVGRGYAAAIVPAQVVLAQPTYVAQPPRARLKQLPAHRGATPAQAQTTAPPPAFVARARAKPTPARRRASPVPLDQPGFVQALRVRLKLPKLLRGRQAQPAPPQITVAAPTYPPQGLRTRVKFVRLFRGHASAPVPDQVVVTPPGTVPQLLHARARLLRAFRGRPAAPVPPQVAPAQPVYVPARVRQAVKIAVTRRAHTATPTSGQAPVPLVARVKSRIGRLLRGKPQPVTPPQVIVTPPPYPQQAVRGKRRLWSLRRRRAGMDGYLIGAAANPCTTPRPSTGTTARPGSGITTFNTATTARPDSGTTARPNTGQTADPC